MSEFALWFMYDVRKLARDWVHVHDYTLCAAVRLNAARIIAGDYQ